MYFYRAAVVSFFASNQYKFTVVLEASIDFCYHHFSKVSEVFSPERNFTREVEKTDRIV